MNYDSRRASCSLLYSAPGTIVNFHDLAGI